MNKIIFLVLGSILLMQVSIYSQPFMIGIGLFNNYSFSPGSIKISNNSPFDISDSKYFGKGIENGEGRMRYEPNDVKSFTIPPQFDISILFGYKKMQLEISTGIQNLNLSYNFLESKYLSFGPNIGYGLNKLIRGTSLGNISFIDGYMYPMYNGGNELFYNGESISLDDSYHHILSAGLHLNVKNNTKKGGGMLFFRFSAFYAKSNLKYNLFDNQILFKPGTYDEFIPNVSANSFGFNFRIGYYFWAKFN